MSDFLNHDYGSEEEDDDFNPAPVDDSDAEDSKVSDTTIQRRVAMLTQSRQSSPRSDARVPRRPPMM